MALKRNKLFVTAALLTCLLVVSASSALASDKTVNITGNVTEATTVDITAPLAMTFSIDPNASTWSGAFTSSSANITSDSKAPVDVDFIGFQADAGNTCLVVNHTDFTDVDWAKLGTKATEEKIALGMKQGSNTTMWSPAGVTPVTNTAAGTVPLAAGETKSISVQAKYGLSWKQAKALQYKSYIKVKLSDIA